MDKFTNDAKSLLEYVGGKENIKAISHCVTRMRFVLVDDSKADIEKIESLSSTKGTFTQAGQFQVIIGNRVQEFYNVFTVIAGIEGASENVETKRPASNQTMLQKTMSNIGEIFAPLIPAIICGGLLVGFRSIIGDIKFLEEGTKTISDVSQFWSGINHFLWMISEAIFHFMPVGIVWSITKKMGTTQILGIVLGITLVSPQLISTYAIAEKVVTPVWNFGFTQIPMIGYQGEVVPAILAGFTLVYLEKLFKKITPEVISIIIVPFCALLLSVFLTQIVIAPIGLTIGNGIGSTIYGGLTSPFGWLLGGCIGLLYAPLVINGLHHITNAIDVQLVSQFNGTIFWPMLALSNIAQGSAVLGMMFLQKKNKLAKKVNVPACISCYLGVTEPALFEVNLKYKFPFICGMVGSAIASMFCVSTGVMATSIGVGGIPGILSIIPKFMPRFALAILIAVVVPFLLTYLVGKKKLTSEQVSGKQEKVNTSQGFVACMEGILMTLDAVEDQVFSSRAMGDGFTIELHGNTVIAPTNGEVIMMFPTNHAYGLRLDDGKELLIHIGMDTVALGGEGFTPHVSVGDYLQQGDPIVTIDIEFIKSMNKSLVSPVIFTSGEKISVLKNNKEVSLLEEKIIKIN